MDKNHNHLQHRPQGTIKQGAGRRWGGTGNSKVRPGTFVVAAAVLCLCHSPLVNELHQGKSVSGDAAWAKPTVDDFEQASNVVRGPSNPIKSSAGASSFAYAVSHTVKPLPEAVFASFVAPDAIPYEFEASDTINHPPDMTFNPRVGAPRELSRSAACDAIVSVARGHHLPVPFFANLIWQESNFNPRDISRAGAQGIAQFMPQTAVDYGLINPFEPIHALNVAARFLNELYAQFGNLGLAAAAYNAGPRRVTDWIAKRGALPAETRNYVLRITGQPAARWTDADAKSDPELALMPAKAPCAEVAEAVREQAQVVRVAKLIVELAQATAPAPEARKSDESERKVADAKPEQRTRIARSAASGRSGNRGSDEGAVEASHKRPPQGRQEASEASGRHGSARHNGRRTHVAAER